MSIQDGRADLVQILENAGLTAIQYVDEAVTPPLVIVTADEPYLERKTFGPNGQWVCRLALLIVEETGTNELMTETLDNALETVLLALDEYAVTDVSAPFVAPLNDIDYLAVKVTVQNLITLGGTN